MVFIRKLCPEHLRKQHAKKAAAARKKAMRVEGACTKALRRKHAAKLANEPADAPAPHGPEPDDHLDFPPSSRPPSPSSDSPIEVADSAIVLEDEDNDACQSDSRDANNCDIARSIGRNLIVPSSVQVDTLLNILCAFQDTEETEEALQHVLRLAAASAKPGDEFGVQFLHECISQLIELSIDSTRLATIIDLMQQGLEKVCDRAICQVRSLGKSRLTDCKIIQDVERLEEVEGKVQPTADMSIDQVSSTIDSILNATMEDLVHATEEAEQRDAQATPIAIEAELDAAMAGTMAGEDGLQQEEDIQGQPIAVEAGLDAAMSGTATGADEAHQEDDAQQTPNVIETELDVSMSGTVADTDEAEQEDVHATSTAIEAEFDAAMSGAAANGDAAEQEDVQAATVAIEAELDASISSTEEVQQEGGCATPVTIEAELDAPMSGTVTGPEEEQHRDATATLTKTAAMTELMTSAAADAAAVPAEAAHEEDVRVAAIKSKRNKNKKKKARRSSSLAAAMQDKFNAGPSHARRVLRPWKPNDGKSSFYVARAPMTMPLDLFVRSAVDAHYFASDESPATIAAYTREIRRVWTHLQPEQRAAWVKLFNSPPNAESLPVRGQKLLKAHGLLVKSLSDACVPE